MYHKVEFVMFSQIGDRFDLSRGLACRTIHKFIRVLSKLLNDFVIWPKGSFQSGMLKFLINMIISNSLYFCVHLATVKDFRNLRFNYMPNTIGCIDGCHICIHTQKTRDLIIPIVKCSNQLFFW